MELERSLLAWVRNKQINALGLSRPCKALGDLVDGILLLEVMTRMYKPHSSPSLFDLSRTLTADSESLHTRVSNLRRLTRGLDSLYRETLDSSLDDFGAFDPLEIAKKGEKSQVMRLLEVVVDAVVRTECKAVLAAIRDLPETQQTVLVQYIQRVQTRLGSAQRDETGYYKKEVVQLRADNRGLSAELAAAKSRLQDLEGEVAGLKKQLAELPAEALVESSLSKGQNKQEMTRLALALAEREEAVETMRRELGEARRKGKEREEALQDELYVALERIQTLESLEIELQQARSKIESLKAVKTQVGESELQRKSAESQLSSALLDLSTLPALRSQLKLLQDQLRDAQLHEEVQKSTIEDLHRQLALQPSQSSPALPRPNSAKLSEVLEATERDKEELRTAVNQLRSETADAWGKYNKLVLELKDMYQEKDSLAQKYLQSKEANMQLQGLLAEREAALKAVETAKAEAPVERGESHKVREMEQELEAMKLQQELQKAKELLTERQRHIQVLETENQRIEAAYRKSREESEAGSRAERRELQQSLEQEREEVRVLTLLKEDMAQNWLREQQLMATVVLQLGRELQGSRVERHTHS